MQPISFQIAAECTPEEIFWEIILMDRHSTGQTLPSHNLPCVHFDSLFTPFSKLCTRQTLCSGHSRWSYNHHIECTRSSQTVANKQKYSEEANPLPPSFQCHYQTPCMCRHAKIAGQMLQNLEVRFWEGGGGGRTVSSYISLKANYSHMLKYFLGIIAWPRDYNYIAI